MENNDNNEQDQLNSDPIEEEATKTEKPPPKTHVVSSSRRTLANITHYSDLRHFQRLVNEYQKNPEALPRALYDVCEAHSKHTLSCGSCLDCGTLNMIVLELNRSDILPVAEKIQHYLSACTKVLTGRERIKGGPALGFQKLMWVKTEKNVAEVTLDSDEEEELLSPTPVTTAVAANPLSTPLFVSAGNSAATAPAACHPHSGTAAPPAAFLPPPGHSSVSTPAPFHPYGSTPTPAPVFTQASFPPHSGSTVLMSPQSTASSSVSTTLLSTSQTRPSSSATTDSHSHHSRRRRRSRSPIDDGFEARVVREFREIREAIRVSHMDCACVRNAVGAFQAINYLVNKLDPDRADGPSSKFSPRDNGHGGGRGGGRGGKRQFNRY